MMAQAIAASAGFLLAVLWFDLMFDVQVLRHRREARVPDEVLDSIGGYYRRITTTASPMGRLVAVVMFTLIGALIVQAMRHDVPRWASGVSIAATVLAVGLAMLRVFGRARRLGAGSGPVDARSALARSIFRDHLICLLAVLTLLTVQLGTR